MSDIGYHRIKIIPSAVGTTEVKLYINGALASTATVVAKEFCTDFKILKYLDGAGRYRFFPFNNKWQRADKPTSVGKVNNFVTSILDGQTAEKNIGYKTERTLTLTAGNVSEDELDKLADIYSSPRVYLYVGDGAYDRVKDWILVTVSGDGVGRKKNNKFSKVTIEVKLPEYYAVTKV
jgi:hypothetical protein